MQHVCPLKSPQWMAAILFLVFANSGIAGQWKGSLTGEFRLFPNDPLYSGQHGHNVSLSFQPEYYHEWEETNERVVFSPFLRIDQHDNRRSHGDIRELYWHKKFPRWELRLGFQKVFWGVVESQNLVNIINQVDAIEGVASDAKLGQPMVHVSWVPEWGTIDGYWMPYFRERSSPGRQGRFRAPVVIDGDSARYESRLSEWHSDFALRYSHYFGHLDVAISHFIGTSRDPRYLAQIGGLTFTSSSVWANLTGTQIDSPILKLLSKIPSARLIPYYDQINQTGLELQYIVGGWALKLEAIHRSGQERTYTAATGGLEYTLYSIFKSPLDATVILEYLWDSRGDDALTPFANDIFAGTRISFNDVQSTIIQGGVIVDVKTQAIALALEASRRLGNDWRISFTSGLFANIPANDILTTAKKDDYIQAELTWFF